MIGIACYCYKKRNEKQNEEIMVVKNAMAITIAIGKYDEYPDSQNEALQEIYLGDLDVEQDIENLSTLFGKDYLNYKMYPEYDNLITLKMHWTQEELIEFLNEKAEELNENIDKYDGLIVTISGHGWKDHICTSDYEMVQKTAIHRIFSQPYPSIRALHGNK